MNDMSNDLSKTKQVQNEVLIFFNLTNKLLLWAGLAVLVA